MAALTGVGGWQRTVAVPPPDVWPLPAQLDLATAAGMILNYSTAHFGLRVRGGLRAGETVVVQGAAGGIGSASLQLAKAYGAKTIAVVSAAVKEPAARLAGADHVVLADGFLDRVRALTDGLGADIVVDPVGGSRFADSLRCLGSGGRLLVVGFAAGGDIPLVKVNRLLFTNVSVVGVGGGPDYLREQWAGLDGLLTSGRLRPTPVHSRPVESASEVLREMAGRRLTGKTVLSMR